IHQITYNAVRKETIVWRPVCFEHRDQGLRCSRQSFHCPLLLRRLTLVGGLKTRCQYVGSTDENRQGSLRYSSPRHDSVYPTIANHCENLSENRQRPDFRPESTYP